VPETDRGLTFGGAKSITIAAGKEAWSDPVALAVPQHADVAISVFVPGSLKPTAFHATGLKTNYLSAPGDFMSAATMPPTTTPPAGAMGTMVFFVSDLQVMAPARTKVIVAIGDSITDGSQSTPDTNGSWPDLLSKQLPALPDGTPVSVINMGIGSNRLVSADTAGPSAVHRFDTDVLARPNVTDVIIFEGVNDLGYEHATAEQLIGAMKEMIAKAYGRHIKVFGGTILPIENGTKYTLENEATRQAVNQWIRTSGAYDGVFDFEKVVADPKDPLTIRSDLTPDHVHPNSVGYRMMAGSIDLRVFE
jgi:lysophospholipase L1-like esterase